MIANCLNPKWKEHFTVNYQFNRDREFQFQVWHYINSSQRELTGEARCRLTDIVMAEDHTLELGLKLVERPGESRGKLKVCADTLKSSEHVVKL